MSGLLDMIAAQLDNQSLGQLGNQLGASPNSLTSAIGVALPVLLGGLERNARTDSGAEALQSALNRDHDGSVMNDLSSFFKQQPTQSDARMVEHILGSRRQASERSLGQATGLNQETIGSLLENLAPVVMGALGQRSRSEGFDIGQLASMLGSETRDLDGREPATMGMINQLLDSDGDGDVDVADLAKHGASLLNSFLRR
ncbi:MAG: DUF937 domain-containing protein [Arenicellales bacterium]|nr:DUF937 domain-containing protein [Arenicellales bacterium]